MCIAGAWSAAQPPVVMPRSALSRVSGDTQWQAVMACPGADSTDASCRRVSRSSVGASDAIGKTHRRQNSRSSLLVPELHPELDSGGTRLLSPIRSPIATPRPELPDSQGRPTTVSQFTAGTPVIASV